MTRVFRSWEPCSRHTDGFTDKRLTWDSDPRAGCLHGIENKRYYQNLSMEVLRSA